MSGSKPTRVIIVTDTMHPFVIGGKEHRHFQIASRLVKAGIEVAVYTTKCWSGPRRLDIDGIEFVGLSRDRPRYAGSRRTVWQAVTFSLACLRLVAERFDLVDVDAIPLLPVLTACLAARLRRRPVVVTFHEIWSLHYWIGYAGPLLGPACALMQWIALRLPEVVIAGSAATARRIHAGRSVRLVTIEGGVDADVLTAVRAAGPWADLLYAGHLMPHKRVHLAIEALALLRARERPLTLLIVGTGQEEAALRGLAARLDLAESVIFQPPWENRERYVSALKSARVMVMPSAREGFGIGVLEALTLGIPVVMANDAGNLAKELVRPADRASIVAPDARSFASAISDWLDSASTRQSGGRQVPRTWDRCAAETLDLYAETLSNWADGKPAAIGDIS